ncbi:hypothetical protein LguiA_031573 [Lonicera macranthoides]
MAILPPCLELTISLPGFTSSPSLPSSAGENEGDQSRRGGGMRDLDINQLPCLTEEEEDEEEEERRSSVPRKKLRLTKEQSLLLEESFRQNHTLSSKQKEGLAKKLELKARQVEVWFQNRRARTRLKQTEMECEYLKRSFGSLTEENRKLQKEVEQLRAKKSGLPTIVPPHSSASSTLSMCPQCKRVTTTATATAKPMNLSPKIPICQSRHSSSIC